MSKRKNNAPKVFSENWKYLVAAVAFLVYIKSVGFGFVLDDDLFVRNHPNVQQGLSTIPSNFTEGSMLHFKGSNFQIYRPFTISFFTIQKSLFGFNPAGFHFVSVMLYVLLCLTVYGLIRMLDRSMHPFYALAGSLLFAVHPVHSEVVANIKGQDELLSALGCLFSLACFLRYVDKGARRDAVLAISAYLMALFSKESAAVFCVIYPVSLLLLRKPSFKELARYVFPFFLAAGMFVACRHVALAGLRQDFETTVIENVLYGATGAAQLWATKWSILLWFLRLMVWPSGLSWDYSFNQIPLADWNQAAPIVSVALYAGLVLIALVSFKRQPLTAWGVSFFLLMILPTSNIFFLNGTTFAERFLFLPSVGWVVVLIPFFAKACKAKLSEFSSSTSSGFILAAVIVLLLAGYTTAARVAEWKDNLTLFESGARNAPRSSRVQSGLATEYMNLAEKSAALADRTRYVSLAREHFKAALEIYPANANAAYRLGLIEAISGDTAASIRLYRTAIAVKPDLVFARVNLATIFASQAAWDSASFHLTKAYETDSLNEMVLTNLMVVNFNLKKDDQVKRYAAVASRNGLANPKIEELLRMSMGRAVRAE